MVIATRLFPRNPAAGAVAVLLAIGLLAASSTAPAQQSGSKNDGMFISVPPEITTGVVNQIKNKVKEVVGRRGKGVSSFAVIFDFNPNDQPGSTSSFGACLDLADFIANLRLGQGDAAYPNMKTVAFVHGEVSRHSVLPVLACGELIMSDAADPGKQQPRARIGDVLRDGDNLSDEKRRVYETINKGLQPALVLRLIYRDLVIREVKTRDGVRYWTDKEVAEHRAAGDNFKVEDKIPSGLEAGNTVLDSKQARDVGLCKAQFKTREEILRAYKLPRSALSEDFLGERTQVVWRIEVRGQLNGGKIESLERRLHDAVVGHATLIFLQLNCEGGDTVDAASMARILRSLKDQNGLPIKTVAFAPHGTKLGAATMLALGCNEIVMASDAVLGDFSYLPDKSANVLGPKRDMLVKVAEEQGYPKLLFKAMLDPDLVLYRVQSRTDPGVYDVVTEEERQRDAQQPAPHWNPNYGERLNNRGELLKLDARAAKEWGVALYADVDSLDALYAKYGIEVSKVRVAGDGWLERAAEFFREPLVKVVLIMLGIIGLILELKMPGVGVPGIVAAICFVLFFWAHSFESQFTILAVLLFVLGLILLGIEIFVLPGFGITGISGILLVVGSLVLVTLQKMPSTMEEWLNLGGTLATFGVSLGLAITGAVVLAWYLPHIPYANRLVLTPPGEDPGSTPAAEESSPHAALLGAIGVAATTLRPAGKARFGDDFLDVVAEGDYVDPGNRVQVIEIEGNRIVVKQV